MGVLRRLVEQNSAGTPDKNDFAYGSHAMRSQTACSSPPFNGAGAGLYATTKVSDSQTGADNIVTCWECDFQSSLVQK